MSIDLDFITTKPMPFDALDKKADYISREAATEELCRDCEACGGDKGVCTEYRFIQALPAADVRPVVLCRDCKHSAIDLENMRYCKCVVNYNHVTDDWFCADGEKREES